MRLGWSHRDEYGWFMSAASVPLALAIVALTIVHLLVARYDARAAAGAFDEPRIASGIGAPILGAAIGDVPDDASLTALKDELDARLHGIPWKRALVLRSRGSALAIQSLFFPFNSLTPEQARRKSSTSPRRSTSQARR